MHNGNDAPICAAIDIGSNTIHVTVARCFPTTLDILADELELVRIGESVTTTGNISPEKLQSSITTIRAYQELAAQHQASVVVAVATEAIRQAGNSAQFLAAIHEATGLEVQLIAGAVEAMLTFYGATYELTCEPGAPSQVGVMDLGGGSTELVIAQQQHITWHTSLPVGSGWLHDRYLPGNPPSHDDVDIARTFLHTFFQKLPAKPQPPALIATGGSANSLFYLARDAFQLNPAQRVLSYDMLMRCEGLLLALPTSEIATRYNMAPTRARILTAGTLIIRAVMERWHLRELRVSTHGIREGCLLAYARYGEHWLSQVAQLAQETGQQQAGTEFYNAGSFIQGGQSMLKQRLAQMLEWRAAVLQHKDVEAVHKMRVASRRLRATLDAYQGISNHKSFELLYRQVKRLADMLGKARDTDVMIAHLLTHRAQETPDVQQGTEWLIACLQTYRQQHQHTLDTFLRQLDTHALQQLAATCLTPTNDTQL